MEVRLCVIVEQNHIGSRRRLKAHIHSTGEPGVLRQENGRNLLLLQPLHASVRGTVVHHQDVKIPANLHAESFETGFHKLKPVIIGYDDGHLSAPACPSAGFIATSRFIAASCFIIASRVIAASRFIIAFCFIIISMVTHVLSYRPPAQTVRKP